MNEFRFFNPYAEIRHTENRLPHWQQEGAVYFLTFRLADAIPAKLREQLDEERRTWLRAHPMPWSGDIEREYHKRFSGAIERWLDAGYGSCVLQRADCREIVNETLHHFDGERLALISAIIMPNHVHALFVQNVAWPLEKILYSWKRFTARRINAVLERHGGLWQRDYFDRLVRDETHFLSCVRYIRRNPRRAHLPVREFYLYESAMALAVE
jgi:putative transposase